jgi:hypothetical protein
MSKDHEMQSIKNSSTLLETSNLNLIATIHHTPSNVQKREKFPGSLKTLKNSKFPNTNEKIKRL